MFRRHFSIELNTTCRVVVFLNVGALRIVSFTLLKEQFLQSTTLKEADILLFELTD